MRGLSCTVQINANESDLICNFLVFFLYERIRGKPFVNGIIVKPSFLFRFSYDYPQV